MLSVLLFHKEIRITLILQSSGCGVIYFFAYRYETFRCNLLPLVSRAEKSKPYFSTLNMEHKDSSEMFLSLYTLQHGITSQKTATERIRSVRTSNLTSGTSLLSAFVRFYFVVHIMEKVILFIYRHCLYISLYDAERESSKYWCGNDEEGSGRGLILRNDPGICLEGLKNTTNIFNKLVSSDKNWGKLTTRHWGFVLFSKAWLQNVRIRRLYLDAGSYPATGIRVGRQWGHEPLSQITLRKHSLVSTSNS
jgi:hypothetical protein